MTPAKLIVVMAFKASEDGELVPAFEPREARDADRATREAKLLAALGQYAGVIAWVRSARPDIGEYGEPTVLFSWGKIPEME